MLQKHEYALPPSAVPDQPARLRGGRPAAQLRRRGRRAVPHAVGDQPADQEPGRRARRAAVRPRHAPGRDLARRPDAPARGRALARQARRSVQQIRRSRSRRRVSVATFASFGSLWLLPRIEAFQREHPDIDIRVSAHDAIADLDDPELDLALRYLSPAQVPRAAVHMFDETLTPVVSRGLWEQIRLGEAPPLAEPADLAAAHPGRGRRRPAEHRVPELAPLARGAGPARTCSRGAGSTSTSPTSRCRRRSPATGWRWRGCRWSSRRCSAASWSSRSAPPAASAARTRTGWWSAPAGRGARRGGGIRRLGRGPGGRDRGPAVETSGRRAPPRPASGAARRLAHAPLGDDQRQRRCRAAGRRMSRRRSRGERPGDADRGDVADARRASGRSSRRRSRAGAGRR